MALSDHYKGGLTERLLGVVITSDPATERIEIVSKDAAVIQVSVSPPPALFRWPKEGEYWTIVRENGVWSLETMVENPDAIKRIGDIGVGEALVQAEVLWTPSGNYFIKQTDLAPYATQASLASYVTQTALDARPRISDEFTANSGSMASGAESATLNVPHSLGVVPSVVSGHLEDGSWSHQCGWRVTSKTNTQVSIKFLNHGSNTATAILRFRLIY